MRLTEDIALVGGGAMTGFGLSSDFDAHVYLLDGGEECALVDCGMGTPSGIERVLENAKRAGIPGERITKLFLTHYHTDHAGGAAIYRERLSLQVAVGAGAKDALELPDHDATGFAAAKAAGIFPSGYDYKPCVIDDPLADGAERRVGRLSVRFIETPGHCGAHGSYLVTAPGQSYLLAGDAVFAGGKLFLQAIPDCDINESMKSVARLAALDFDALLPGHGAICLRDGRSHVELANASIGRLALPANLV
jgi:hydroxyacylglutathione hydrolase